MLTNFVPRITVEIPRNDPKIIERFSFGTPDMTFGSVGNIEEGSKTMKDNINMYYNIKKYYK